MFCCGIRAGRRHLRPRGIIQAKQREVSRIFQRLRMHPRVQRWIHSKTYFFCRGLIDRYLRHDVGSLAAEAPYYPNLALVPVLVVGLK